MGWVYRVKKNGSLSMANTDNSFTTSFNERQGYQHASDVRWHCSAVIDCRLGPIVWIFVAKSDAFRPTGDRMRRKQTPTNPLIALTLLTRRQDEEYKRETPGMKNASAVPNGFP